MTPRPNPSRRGGWAACCALALLLLALAPAAAQVIGPVPLDPYVSLKLQLQRFDPLVEAVLWGVLATGLLDDIPDLRGIRVPQAPIGPGLAVRPGAVATGDLPAGVKGTAPSTGPGALAVRPGAGAAGATPAAVGRVATSPTTGVPAGVKGPPGAAGAAPAAVTKVAGGPATGTPGGVKGVGAGQDGAAPAGVGKVATGLAGDTPGAVRGGAAARLELPGSVAGARAAGTVDTPVAVPAAAALLLTRLMAGDRSEEVVARVGALRTEELIAALEGCSRWQREEQAAADVLALELLRRPGVPQDGPGELKYPVALAVADALARRGEERCVGWYEGLLQRRTRKVNASVPELEALALFYTASGQHRRAAETWLRHERLSGSTPSNANACVEAARCYLRGGQTAEAIAQYQRIPTFGYGWATAIGRADHGRLLLRQGRYREALAAASGPLTGAYAEVAQLATAVVRAQALAGLAKPREAVQVLGDGIRAYEQSGTRLANENLEALLVEARALLVDLGAWCSEPLRVSCRELRVAATPDARGNRGADFWVTTPFDGRPDAQAVGASVDVAWQDAEGVVLGGSGEPGLRGWRHRFRADLRRSGASGADGAGFVRIGLPKSAAQVDVPVSVEVAGRVRLEPPAAFLGKPGGASGPTIIRVLGLGRVARVLRATASAQWVSVRVADDTHVELALRQQTAVAGYLATEVTIAVAVDGYGEELCRVPCQAVAP